jgi:hypothetical protein
MATPLRPGHRIWQVKEVLQGELDRPGEDRPFSNAHAPHAN